MADHDSQIAAMKILFFTPCLKASAIGRVSTLVVTELRRLGHQLVVVRAEEPNLFLQPTHDFGCNLVNWNEADRIQEQARNCDLTLYNVGNNFQYHRGCMEWLKEHPGLVCLHDNFLGHLFWSYSEVVGRTRAKELLVHFYGETVSHRFFDHATSASFIEYASEAAPMTEWIASMATGVLVHSSWAMDRISRSCPGPVEVVPLPYDAPHLKPPLAGKALAQTNTKGDGLSVLTIGHVNPNKRHASVIKAIGSSELLRERMCFRIVGAIEPPVAQALQAQADALGVRVVISGEVDSWRLAAEIHAADAMCCLRWPALESASASTIEAMLYGKATIVTDTGFYRDLPDDCVLKISPVDEVNSLRAALERLAQAPDERLALGNLALHYATATFRADHYAERIVAMRGRIAQAKILAGTAHMFTATLKRWGMQSTPDLLDPVAAPLAIFQ